MILTDENRCEAQSNIPPLLLVPSCEGQEDALKHAAAVRWFADRNVFVVPGAMKGGTCSLRHHLCATAWEDNLSLPWSEVHFFDDDKEHARGAAYYASWFQWEGWSPRFVGAITPSYLYMPVVVPRLHQLVPHAKLVVMLRNIDGTPLIVLFPITTTILPRGGRWAVSDIVGNWSLVWKVVSRQHRAARTSLDVGSIMSSCKEYWASSHANSCWL